MKVDELQATRGRKKAKAKQRVKHVSKKVAAVKAKAKAKAVAVAKATADARASQKLEDAILGGMVAGGGNDSDSDGSHPGLFGNDGEVFPDSDVDDNIEEFDSVDLDPPLLDAVRQMILQLDSGPYATLVENWKALSVLSKHTPLCSGSGCTGSGLDWYTLKLVSEACRSADCFFFFKLSLQCWGDGVSIVCYGET